MVVSSCERVCNQENYANHKTFSLVVSNSFLALLKGGKTLKRPLTQKHAPGCKITATHTTHNRPANERISAAAAAVCLSVPLTHFKEKALLFDCVVAR